MRRVLRRRLWSACWLRPWRRTGPRRQVIFSDFYKVRKPAGKKADDLVNLYCWAGWRRHIGDTARNAAVIWTITGTAQMAGLDILTYLDECGRNRGKPLTGPALERFLPWNASPEHLRTWARPPPAR